MGRGPGYRWRAAAPFYPYSAPYSANDEAEMLSREAQHLEACLDEIKKRLTKLEETPEPKT
jgi:primosomal protein N''